VKDSTFHLMLTLWIRPYWCMAATHWDSVHSPADPQNAHLPVFKMFPSNYRYQLFIKF